MGERPLRLPARREPVLNAADQTGVAGAWAVEAQGSGAWQPLQQLPPGCGTSPGGKCNVDSLDGMPVVA